MIVAADSSFIFALYVVDSHSPDAHHRMAIKPSVTLAPFNRVELAHALHFQVFLGKITLRDAARAWRNFEDDCERGLWVSLELPARTWETGIDLARKFGPTLGIRTLDSLHVACALELRAQKFWTFDERQARLAEAVGLDTKS